jgi:hypothetical protein
LFEDSVSLHSGGGVNIFTYGRPLDCTDWAGLEICNIGTTLPDIALITFCDSLLSFANGDQRQSLIQMASACDQEVNQLVDNALSTRAPSLSNLLKKRLKYEFQSAHSEIMRDLGLCAFKDFDQKAASLVNELYECRGKAIHQKYPAMVLPDPARFLWAVEKLFSWSQTEFLKL